MKGGTYINYICYICLICLLLAAVICDMKTYRVPNYLNAVGCITGVLYSVLTQGIRGLGHSLLGIGIPVVLLFVLFRWKVVGAGDIKLLSAIGSFVYADIVKVVLMAFVMAAVYGAFSLICRAIRQQMKGVTRIHLTVAIAAGTLCYLLGGGVQ